MVVIALDQLTKHTLGTWIKPGQVRHVIPGLTLVYERNTRRRLQLPGGHRRAGLRGDRVALVALVAFLMLRPQRRLLWLPDRACSSGGAVGNLIDRVARGSVIDFIKLPHWPAFNFADTSITFGVIILVLVIERGPRDA